MNKSSRHAMKPEVLEPPKKPMEATAEERERTIMNM
jgi:hypothetical protein